MDKNLIIFDFKSNLRNFIILIVILLIEGLVHHYYYFISSWINFLEFRNQSGHNKLTKHTPLFDSDNDSHYPNYINLIKGGKNG